MLVIKLIKQYRSILRHPIIFFHILDLLGHAVYFRTSCSFSFFVTVQDFSYALFEFFPLRKLAVTEHDHMRLTLRAMFIACDCNMAKVVTFDNPTNINDESGMLSAIAERVNRSGYPERSGK